MGDEPKRYNITRENARANAERSATVRREKRERKRADAVALRALGPILPEVAGMPIGDLAAAALRRILAHVALGDVVVPAQTIPALVKALHEVSLLEAERPTVVTATANGASRQELREALEAYRAEWSARASRALPIESSPGPESVTDVTEVAGN